MTKKIEMNFVRDLIVLLIEDALETKKELTRCKDNNHIKYLSGKLNGYWEVLDTIDNQLVAFQIKKKDVGFRINIDKELIKK